MAKQYEGIAVLGESLMSDKRSRANRSRIKREKREEKNALIGFGLDIFKKIGNKIITAKNDDFLKQEGFYAKNVVLDANIKQANSYKTRWDNRLLHKGGEDDYFLELAKNQINALPSDKIGTSEKDKNEYAAYFYAQTKAFKEKLKKDYKFQNDQAISYLGKLGENPKEAGRNEMLKGRAENVFDYFTLPIINKFAGRDKFGTTNDAIKESLEDEDGLIAQGKVKKEDVQSIFDITANYKTAIQIAEELETFRKNYKGGIEKLGAGPITYSEYVEVNYTDENGEQQSRSQREAFQGGQNLGTFDANGARVTKVAKIQSLNKQALNVSEKRIAGVATVVTNNLNKPDRKMLNSFATFKLGDKPTTEQQKQFYQHQYGKIAVSAKSVQKRFGNVAGWSEDLSTLMATQMAVENLRLGYNSSMFSEEHDASKDLLANRDAYHPYVALAAYDALVATNQMSERLMQGNRLRDFLASEAPKKEHVLNYDVGDANAENELAARLKIKIPEAAPTPEQQMQDAAAAAKNKKANTVLKLKTVFQVETNPTVTSNANSKAYQAALSDVGSLEENAALIQTTADARIKELKEALAIPDRGMYSANRIAVKRAEIKRLETNPNTILQD